MYKLNNAIQQYYDKRFCILIMHEYNYLIIQNMCPWVQSFYNITPFKMRIPFRGCAFLNAIT